MDDVFQGFAKVRMHADRFLQSFHTGLPQPSNMIHTLAPWVVGSASFIPVLDIKICLLHIPFPQTPVYSQVRVCSLDNLSIFRGA